MKYWVQETHKFLCFRHRLAPSNVTSIIFPTCEVIWETMAKNERPEPTEEMWTKTVDDFYSMWQFLNCIGTIDGKHSEIQAPKNRRSLYLNYK